MMRAVIAIVVVLVVVAGFVVLQTKNGGEVAPQQPTVAAAEMPAKSLHPEVHVIDCGKPDVLEDYMKDPTIIKDGKPIKVLELGHAVEGEPVTFLHSPKWINNCDISNDIKENPEKSAGKLAGLAVYNFEVQRDDTFYVFLSAKWTDTCGNSVFVLMNGPEKGGHGPDDGEYHTIKDQNGFVSEKDYKLAWHPLVKQGKLIEFKLKKGPNRIELHTRQDGPRFDQIVISTEANAPAIPRVKVQ